MSKIYAIQDRIETYSGVGRLASSSDGTTWTSVLIDNAVVYIYGAACDSTGDTIVLLLSNSQYVLRSTDAGNTWATINTANPGNSVFTIRYVGDKFVTCCQNGVALISSTGSSWTSVTVSAEALSLWDVVGVGGALVFATSGSMLYLANGASSGTATGPSGFSAEFIYFLNGKLFAFNNAFETYTTTIASSTDGISWTTTELDSLGDYNNIRLMYGNNIAIYAGGFYWVLYWRTTTPAGTVAVKLLKSADGVSWTSVTVASGIASYDLRTDCALNNLDSTLVMTAYAYGTNGLKTSTNGTSWSVAINDDSSSRPYLFLFKSGTTIAVIQEFWQSFVSSYEILSEA